MGSIADVIANGLSVARLRVNVLASNIANAETTKTADGTPYRRKDVMQVAVTEDPTFSSALDRATLAKPAVAAVVEDQSDPRKVFQPGHPDADKDGFVSYPNINVVTAMTDLMSASRLYQANVTAMETYRSMERDAASLSTSV
jgi:flagellar basal-body rod protein FlgC